MIKISQLVKRFNQQLVLDHIDLEIHEGELLVILGESGSGKSVFLKHLIGLHKPDSGQIDVDGVDITRLSERALLELRKNMGYLFQEGALYDFMTVYENVAFPLREHTRIGERQIDEKVRHFLKIVGLEDAIEKYPSELSGGMKKRAALARAVVLSSKILLCDEPTSGLDPIRSRDISDLIHDITRHLQCTTVVTSHDIRNAFRIADRIALIHDGRIVSEGTPETIRRSDNSLVREFFLEPGAKPSQKNVF